jgi:class 3 adenylate cyclase
VLGEIYSETLVRDTIPGPFIFATTINNILRNEVLRESPAQVAFALVFFAGILACVIALKLRLASALAILTAFCALWVAAAVGLFARGLVVPLIDPIAVAVTAFAVMLGYRFAITDSERRRIRRAFSYYLPPSVIETMVRRGSVPRLGGETRDVTIFYSDLAGFTRVCEGLTPEDVVRIMNRYLNAVTKIIEAHGGYVDKYIGDAVLAIFGAPLADHEHARHAVEAALACRNRVAEIQPNLGLPEGRRLRARTGINSGPALIGNIGSDRRFNYTAMGDTVNLVARLESTNKVYGTDILASGATAAQLGGGLALAPLERVRVQGRDHPVELYEPLGQADQLSAAERLRMAAFQKAWRLRESGDLPGARAVLQQLGDTRSAAVLVAHLETLESSSLPAGSPPVFDLPDK